MSALCVKAGDDLKRIVGTRWALVYLVLGSLETTGDVEAKWADLEPEPVDVPAAYCLMNGVWYKVKQGVKGLLVRRIEVGRGSSTAGL